MKPAKSKVRYVEMLRTAVAIAISLLFVCVVVFIVSDQPLSAIFDFLIGPLTSVRRLGNIVEAMVPLVFTGLAVIMLFRSGLFNLSMEGAFFIGAVAGCASALLLPLPPVLNLLTAMVVAGIAGGLVTLIPGYLKVKCNANELVTSLMLNYVCLYVGLYVITTYLYDPEMSSNYSYKFPESMLLARIIPGTRINTGLIIAALCILAAYLLLNKTPFGYKVTLVGKNGKMARYSGIATGGVIVASQLLGGVFAGLGGAVDMFGMYKRFQYSGLTGYGWDGVLIAIVAYHKAQYVPFAALFLAYLRTGADIMARNSDIPSEIVKIIQAIVILLISASAILSGYKKKLVVQEAKELEREEAQA